MHNEVDQSILGSIAQRFGTPVRLVLPACVLLFIYAVVSLSFASGKTVVLSTNVAKANVKIDNRAGVAIDDMSWRFEHVPFGARRVILDERDHLPAESTLAVGLFSGSSHHVEMERRMVRLLVTTRPGAEIYLNGALAGRANAGGLLDDSQVASGAYDVVVRLSGFTGWGRDAVAIRGEVTRLTAMLQPTESQRAEAAGLLRQARSLFAQRNYDAALSAVERSLTMDPDERSAAQLRDQIRQTIQILR